MLALLRRRSFALLFTGQTVSGLGTWVNFVGLNLYLYELTGSGTLLGSFLVARMLPSLFFGPLGGWLADRHSKRRVMMAGDALRAVLVLGYLVAPSVAWFFALGIVLSALDKVVVAAQGALLPSLVPREELARANALSRMAHSVVSVLGPALGGLLVASGGWRVVFVLDSVSFVVSVACAAGMGDEEEEGKKEREREEGASKRGGGLDETWAWYRASGLLAFASLRLLDALASGAYNTALPVHARALALTRGAAYGWLVTAWALGELAGSLAAARLDGRRAVTPERLFPLSVLVMALGMGATFHLGSFHAALVAIFVGGVGDGLGNVVFTTAVQRRCPAALRGRVIGSTLGVVYTAVACGMGASGLFLDRFGVPLATDGATAFIVAGTLLALLLARPVVDPGPPDAVERGDRGGLV